jgi:hypothetical protein
MAGISSGTKPTAIAKANNSEFSGGWPTAAFRANIPMVSAKANVISIFP